MIRGDSEAIKVSYRNESGVNIPLAEGDIVYFTVKRNTYTEEKILQKDCNRPPSTYTIKAEVTYE